MKLRFLRLLARLAIGCSAVHLGWSEEPSVQGDAALKAEITRITEKMAEKRRSASPTAGLFAPEFAELDALRKQHPETAFHAQKMQKPEGPRSERHRNRILIGATSHPWLPGRWSVS